MKKILSVFAVCAVILSLSACSSDSTGYCIMSGEWNTDGKFYNGRYVKYLSNGSVGDSGTVTNGKRLSDAKAFLSEVSFDIGDAIKDEHPVWGLIFDGIGTMFADQ